MTFSIVARDRDNGDLGIAVASAAPAAGAHMGVAHAGVGAVAVLAEAPTADDAAVGLAALERGWGVDGVLGALRGHPDAATRQTLVVDADGRVAADTGLACAPAADHGMRTDVAAAGHALATAGVVAALVARWGATQGRLSTRLLAALEAAAAAGGTAAPTRSAALRVVSPAAPARAAGGAGGAGVDVRVDDHAEPIVELARLLKARHGG